MANISISWPLKALPGIVLTIAFFAALLWLLTNWGGVIPGNSVRAVTYLGEVVISALLATGMVGLISPSAYRPGG